MASEFYSETGLNTSGRACCCAAQGSVQRQSLAGKSGGQLLPRRSCLCVPGRGTMGPPCASSRAVTVLQAVGAGAVPGRRYDGEPVARALPPVARALTRAALRRGRLPVRAGRRSLAALGRLVALGLPPKLWLLLRHCKVGSGFGFCGTTIMVVPCRAPRPGGAWPLTWSQWLAWLGPGYTCR